MPRLTFERELASLRESLVRMGTLVESQIEAALDALRRRDGSAAEKVRTQDQYLNELFRQMREQVFMVISTQQPVARDLRYLPTRLSNIDIGARLRISQNTVKTHLKDIYRKLRVSSRNEAVVVAVRLGVLNLTEDKPGTSGGLHT